MFTGRKHTPEAIEKIRLSKLGKKRAPFSAEWKAKMAERMRGNQITKGRKLTEEHKKKISRATRGENHPLYGKKHTAESRKKMSESQKGHFSHRKGKKYPQIAGDKHPNWKGGITSENRLIRGSIEYKLWRTAVFERDGYACIVGGKEHGNKLHADHIKPFAWFPELRLAIDNGQTLCEACHRLTPTFAGRSKPAESVTRT